jgi:hypothetical protein
MIDWTKYAVGGAAARPDSFTKLNQDYAQRVAQLVLAAEQELGPRALTITSAYRSPELQAQLYQRAVAKYGSPQAARKWVAPPGKSKHNIGTAVDFADAGGNMLRDANSREAKWVKANAGRFGLDVPMSWEPWQVELAGSRGGAPAGAAPAAPTGASGPPLSFGVGTPAAPTTMAGIAGMFGDPAAGLSMGQPVDPFGGALQRQQMAAQQRRKDEEEAAQTRRAALLSGVGSMFG